MRGCERTEAPGGLLKLALVADPVPAPCLVPGDGDVDEALEEVALGRGSRPPGLLESLVRGEVLALGEQHEPTLVRLCGDVEMRLLALRRRW